MFIFVDFVKAISIAINRPQMLVAYFSTELKTLHDLGPNNTHVHISTCVIHYYSKVHYDYLICS